MWRHKGGNKTILVESSVSMGEWESVVSGNSPHRRSYATIARYQDLYEHIARAPHCSPGLALPVVTLPWS